ncbi:MAG: ROK family transcriptional regulator [Candidatus Nanopelagicaceae bacterium]|nr:ROK family transcriptional regulator [Candidatus Nanopelagicaceae bacterium]
MKIAAPPWIPQSAQTRAVALEVLLHGPISRIDIARRLDLSPGSLTRLSTPLIESGLLVEINSEDRSDSKTGRPSKPLDVVARSRHFIGMKVTGDDVTAVVTDLRANVVGQGYRRLASQVPTVVADEIAALASELAEQVDEITALGIGIGGLVNDKSEVLSAPFLDWENVPLGSMVESLTGIPTVVNNDVIAFTEAEHWFGAASGLSRFAVITLGVGVGFGLVIHNQIVVDEDYGLGLVGHWPIDPFGPLCPSGHKGCARTVLTQGAIIQAVENTLNRNLSYEEILQMATSGEPVSRRVVDDAGRGLGKLIAAVANLTSPELIILGGEGVGLVETASTSIQEGIREHRDPRAKKIRFVTTSGDNTEWCRGAAVLAIQEYVLGRPYSN